MDRDMLWQRLDVGHLGLEPAWVVPSECTASKALGEMRARSFDVAPVAAAGSPLTWVSVEALERARPRSRVVASCQPVAADHRVRLDTPLAVVVERLAAHAHLIVEDRLGGVAVVTRADLARPAFAALALMTVLGLEQRMNSFLELFDDAETLVREALTKRRLGRIDDLIAERQRRRSELPLLKSLSLEDRFDIVLHFEPLWMQFGESKRRLGARRKSAQSLRDTLAHGGTLLDVTDDVTETLRVLADLQRFSQQVEGLVFDRMWTTFAFAEVHLDDGTCLAGRGASAELEQPMWVVTAENPDGVVLPCPANSERTTRLTRYISRRRISHQLGWGGRGTHWERSVVFESSEDVALGVAAHFGQAAVFRLTPTAQEVVRVSDGRTMRSIRRQRRSPTGPLA